MKKIIYLFVGLIGVIAFASCKDTETYADKKKKERAAINQYIADHKVNDRYHQESVCAFQ